jgi:Zn finger protein HypA/HybF involved in hydrogenase expression
MTAMSVQLECGKCGWWTLCGEAEITRRLRAIGLFRRAPEPPQDIVEEMLRTNGLRLPCDRCKATGLKVGQGADAGDAGEWEQVLVCEICREPIRPERLEFMPKTKRCAACQDKADRGATFVEPDYCPKCGSLVELRVSRAGGMTRYKLWCTGNPPCRL